jgi:1-deoxyxylulose-5-phosphate synthase
MDYVRLGTTGMQVSRLCLGCMSFGKHGGGAWGMSEAESLTVLRKAHEAGINFFDTANIYAFGDSEQILGRSLKEIGVDREATVIATKVYFPMSGAPNRGGLSRKNILASIDQSLSRLGLDYVDLYQIHRFDYETPMEETLEALSEVVRAGKARYIGASSMFAWQFAKYLYLADARGLPRFATMQNLYNLVYREEEREMIPLCQSEGVGLMPYSPLAAGVLARDPGVETARTKMPQQQGRFSRPEDRAIVDRVRAVASKRGATPAEVAIAWLLSKPNVTPIIGISKPEQLDPPLKALALKLAPEEIAQLEELYMPQASMGPMMPGQAIPLLRPAA